VYDKSGACSVEGGNAELRHYLALLTRKPRCSSKCIKALHRGSSRLPDAGVVDNSGGGSALATRLNLIDAAPPLI
jgi:hypothetical protein